jgi:hypothetical protein
MRSARGCVRTAARGGSRGFCAALPIARPYRAGRSSAAPESTWSAGGGVPGDVRASVGMRQSARAAMLGARRAAGASASGRSGGTLDGSSIPARSASFPASHAHACPACCSGWSGQLANLAEQQALAGEGWADQRSVGGGPGEAWPQRCRGRSPGRPAVVGQCPRTGGLVPAVRDPGSPNNPEPPDRPGRRRGRRRKKARCRPASAGGSLYRRQGPEHGNAAQTHGRGLWASTRLFGRRAEKRLLRSR